MNDILKQQMNTSVCFFIYALCVQSIVDSRSARSLYYYCTNRACTCGCTHGSLLGSGLISAASSVVVVVSVSVSFKDALASAVFSVGAESHRCCRPITVAALFRECLMQPYGVNTIWAFVIQIIVCIVTPQHDAQNQKLIPFLQTLLVNKSMDIKASVYVLLQE